MRRDAALASLASLLLAAGCGDRPATDAESAREALQVVEIDERDLELYLLREMGTADLEGGGIDEAARRLLRDELRAETLLAAEAERIGIEPPHERLAEEIEAIAELAPDYVPARRERLARTRVLADAYVALELAPRIVVTDEDVEAALGPSERRAAREFVVFRQILLPDRSAADEAYRRVVRQKEAFEDVAAELTTAADGGAPQQRALSQLPSRVAGVLARVPEGTVSKPVQEGDGWYLFQVDARLRDPDPGRERQRAEVRDRLFRETLSRLRSRVVARLAASGHGAPGTVDPADEGP